MPIRTDALLLETILQDSPRFIDLLLERAIEAGGLDAWTSPVADRRGRPALKLSVVAPAALRDAVEAAIVTNSSATTIVATAAETSAMETSSELVTTRFGDVEITHRRWQGRVIDIEPDAAECAAFARQHDIPASTVWNEAYRIGEARIGQKR